MPEPPAGLGTGALDRFGMFGMTAGCRTEPPGVGAGAVVRFGMLGMMAGCSGCGAGPLVVAGGALDSVGGAPVVGFGPAVVAAGAFVVGAGAPEVAAGALVVAAGAFVVGGGAAVVAAGAFVVGAGAFAVLAGAFEVAAGPGVVGGGAATGSSRVGGEGGTLTPVGASVYVHALGMRVAVEGGPVGMGGMKIWLEGAPAGGRVCGRVCAALGSGTVSSSGLSGNCALPVMRPCGALPHACTGGKVPHACAQPPEGDSCRGIQMLRKSGHFRTPMLLSAQLPDMYMHDRQRADRGMCRHGPQYCKRS